MHQTMDLKSAQYVTMNLQILGREIYIVAGVTEIFMTHVYQKYLMCVQICDYNCDFVFICVCLQACDLGYYRLMIVPPNSIIPNKTRTRVGRKQTLISINPPEWPGWSPLIIIGCYKEFYLYYCT